MTAMADWLALRENLKRWGDEWNAGIVEIRLSDGRTMLIDDAVPDTRGDCPTAKPCPHVRCRYHLWRVDGGEGGTRAGRPGLASVPRDKHGLTLRTPGDVGSERPGTTLEARWLEAPVPPSCALDLADTGPMDNQSVGRALARHPTLIGRETRGALNKGCAEAERRGIEADDFAEAIRMRCRTAE